MKIRPANTRGYIPTSRLGLDNYQSYRSFSCMSYQDPNYINWGPVVTINDDRTKPGFVTAWHEHKGLDIINYMISGTCRHRDDKGNDYTAQAGEIQHFWCGDSIWHELSNESTEPARYLQIWIQPTLIENSTATYQNLCREEGFAPLPIKFKNERIEVWAGNLDQNCITQNSYLLVLEGSCTVNGVQLNEGDAVDLFMEQGFIEPISEPHLLLFELT